MIRHLIRHTLPAVLAFDGQDLAATRRERMPTPVYSAGDIIQIEPASNGGWVVFIGQEGAGRKSTSTAAYSNSNDLIHDLSKIFGPPKE